MTVTESILSDLAAGRTVLEVAYEHVTTRAHVAHLAISAGGYYNLATDTIRGLTPTDAAPASPRRRRARYAWCGTDSGYYRHRRDGEPACTGCLAAHAAAERRRRGLRITTKGAAQ